MMYLFSFAEVNLYTSMFLKNKNLTKEKLPVFSMDGKSKFGTIVVSVFGIELMKEITDGSGSDWCLWNVLFSLILNI